MQETKEHRVFITGSGIAEEAQQLLSDAGCQLETGNPKDSAADIADKLSRFDPTALIVRQGEINEAVIDSAGKLEVICKHGVGTDNIDIQAATARGIPVFYTPAANYEAVATHTFALLLSLLRQIPAQDERVRNGVFDKAGYGGRELLGKTLGLLGFGKVGRRLAAMVEPFDLQVVVYHPSNHTESLPGYISKVNAIEDVLTQSDIVSLHCPLTADTQHLLCEKTFRLMKPGAYLINTARGGLVDERALVAALKSQRLSGAALDVFEVEPATADNPLFLQDNVIVTSHIAGSSDNSLRNMGREAAIHILAVLRGEAIDISALKNKHALAVEH